MPKTRKETICVVFGAPEKLKDNVLPTYADIMKHYLWVRTDLLLKFNNKDPAIGEVSAIVATDVEMIWNKATIPILSHQQVIHLIKTYYNKYKNIKKCPKSRINLNKLKNFFDRATMQLFDIAVCKCSDLHVCKCKTKIPICEREFLTDQRGLRNMVIGSVDFKMTNMLKRRLERKDKVAKREKLTSEIPLPSSTIILNNDSNCESSDKEDDEVCYSFPSSVPSTSKNQTYSNQMRKKLPNLAVACDRTGVSDRSAAIIASALLQDIGIVTPEDQQLIVDRSKLRRERKKARDDIQNASTSKVLIPLSIYFDGRKDKTLVHVKKGAQYHRINKIEEHVVLLTEPGSLYIGHVTPISGSAESILKSIQNYMKLNEINLSQLVAIGCDGTNVNTGSKNGIICQMEYFLQRPLHWFVCLLHSNELPLRHLFHAIDGPTSGPKKFSGIVGKSLEACEKMDVVNFNAILVKLPEIDRKDLSTDQKYLYDICLAISAGELPSNLVNREPGKMAHSRWLTTANRILRLYVSTENPTESLQILTEFVMKVYGPTWFEIKTNPLAKNGPNNLLGIIKKTGYLPNELKKIVHDVIQRNSFFAHSENILFSMLQDERKHIRELALRRILKARKRPILNIRTFAVPTLNFDAEEYFDLIQWTDEKCVHEPPITKHMSHDELKSLIETSQEMAIAKFPCHSQAVERHVKLVTEASSAVCGEKRRDGFIRTRLKSRNQMPTFETKKHFFSKFKSVAPPEVHELED